MTNGFQSYAVYIYECGKLEWSGDAIIGFKANAMLSEIHKLSGTNASYVACQNLPQSASTNLVYQLRKLILVTQKNVKTFI